MYAAERQTAIVTLVRQRGSLSVTDLAGAFAVTGETVRRDLTTLERSGLVRRVHGGVVAPETMATTEPGLRDRDAQRTTDKDRIAAAAVRFLPARGGSVLMDGGTTVGRLAATLPGDRDLTVATQALPVATRLAATPRVALHLLGGRVRGRTQAAVGTDTVAAIARLRTDIAFLGTNGVEDGSGFTTPDSEEAAVKRAMIAAAERTVVLADSSKIGQRRLFSFADLADVDVLVTDADADPGAVAALERAGIEVVRA